MTTVYFVRHAQSDHRNKDEQTRGLSEKGKMDVDLVTHYFDNMKIDAAFSSPYQRAIDTIADYTKKHNISIHLIAGFCEWHRKADPTISFDEFCHKHWADHDYHHLDGESLHDVQKRNIDAINEVLKIAENKTVMIGTHGMALSAILSYYNPEFSYEDFSKLLPLTPLIVKIAFNKQQCLSIEQIKLV